MQIQLLVCIELINQEYLDDLTIYHAPKIDNWPIIQVLHRSKYTRYECKMNMFEEYVYIIYVKYTCVYVWLFILYINIIKYICTYQPVPPLSRLHQHPAVCLLAIHLPCLRPNRITVFLTSPVLRRSLYRNGFTIPAPPQVRSMQSAGCCFLAGFI